MTNRPYTVAEDKSLAMTRAIMEVRARYWEPSRRPKRVYFIRCGDFIKIGIAVDPEDRLRNMQIASPYDMEMLHVTAGGKPQERHLHKKFAHLHHRGEWFRTGDDLLAEIQTMVDGS